MQPNVQLWYWIGLQTEGAGTAFPHPGARGGSEGLWVWLAATSDFSNVTQTNPSLSSFVNNWLACSVPGQYPSPSLGLVWAAPPPLPPLCMTTFYRKSQCPGGSVCCAGCLLARPACSLDSSLLLTPQYSSLLTPDYFWLLLTTPTPHNSPHLSVRLVLAALSLHRLTLRLRGVLRRAVSAAGAGPAPAEAPPTPPTSPWHPVSALRSAVTSGSPGGRGASLSLHTVPGGARVAAVPWRRRGLSLPEMEKSG